MKKLIITVLTFVSVTAYSSEKYTCSMLLAGEDFLFSVIDFKTKMAFVGYAGDSIEDATDEFKIRLKNENSSNEIFEFESIEKKDYPGYISLKFNKNKLSQTATFTSEGNELQFTGKCESL